MFLLLNSTAVYGCTTVCLSIPLLGSHLGHFQVLAIMNKTAINMVHKFLCGHNFSNRLGKYLGTPLLDYIDRLCLDL